MRKRMCKLTSRGINGIGLPSSMNAQSFAGIIKTKRPYWLSMHGESLCEATASGHNINYHGTRVTTPLDLRPVLILTGIPYDEVEPGDRFELFGTEWVWVDDFYPAIMPVEPIATMPYSDVGNTYATSAVRAYMEKWLENRKADEENGRNTQ